jgi:ribosomal protein S4E
MTTNIVIGSIVQRTQGTTVGDMGVVTDIHGSIAGDTLITVRKYDGEEFRCYTRQVKVIR